MTEAASTTTSETLRPGQSLPLRVERSTDPATGRTVERFGPETGDALLPYFNRDIVPPDDHGILISCRVNGAWLPFLALPDEQRMICLCDRPMQNGFTPCYGGEHRLVYLTDDRVLGYASLEDGSFTDVAVLPPNTLVGQPTASTCGRYAAFGWYEQAPTTTYSVIQDNYPSAGTETNWFQPRCAVVHVDMETGKTKGIGGGRGRASHPLISPVNPFVVEVCTRASWKIQRMWVIRYYPAGNHASIGPVYEQREGYEAVGHELFLTDGRLAGVYQRYADPNDPPEQTVLSGILVAHPETDDHRLIVAPGMVWNHLHGRDGQTFVSEGRSDLHLNATQRQQLADSPLDGTAGRQLDLVCRYDDDGGDEAKVTPLCATGASWNDGESHPHPVLDRAHRWCYFNSDFNAVRHVGRVRMD